MNKNLNSEKKDNFLRFYMFFQRTERINTRAQQQNQSHTISPQQSQPKAKNLWKENKMDLKSKL